MSYRENQGQYSAENNKPPQPKEIRGGMNYEAGQEEGSEEDSSEKKNFMAPKGGFNPLFEEITYFLFGEYLENPEDFSDPKDFDVEVRKDSFTERKAEFPDDDREISFKQKKGAN